MRLVWFSMWLVSLLVAATAFSEERDPGRAPWACPQWEVDYVDEGIMYFCHYYTTDECTETPQPYYIIGDFDWPADPCSEDCEAAYSGTKGNKSRSKPFQGLEKPIAHEEILELPGGPARRFSRVLTDEAIAYIKFNVKDKELHAKVFVVVSDHGKALGESNSRLVTWNVALQVPSAPTGGQKVVSVKAVALDGDDSFAYAVTHDTCDKEVPPMLVLTAKPKP